ncbi:hypothetical protein BN946_scf184798.g102 [Trametes cinnabarina]|uniref:AMP-dependent synthetase/ligase domain-containing protein n=1 Tax=Pycnoporus cinnabarinus TaxID=5643 RepID=A0A060S8L6_PYCCI|nr:hypothetical protein BN946_scf184798.g102 [Trametes cinnabarina]
MSEPSFAHLPVPENPDADYNKQCIEVPGTKRPGQTAHYRSSAYPFVTLDTPNTFTNLLQIFDEGKRRAQDRLFLGHRPVISTQPLKFADYFEWQTWPEVDARRRAVGSALHKLFQSGALGGGDLPTVGIWSKNSPNWQVIDLALQAYSKYPRGMNRDSERAAPFAIPEFIMNHAELTVVFATPDHIPALLKLAPKAPVLKMIVSMDPLTAETKSVLSAWGETVNVQIKELSELEEFGRANLIDVIPATSDRIATICYTSGTTGQPKGVVITHGAMAQAVYGYLHQFSLDNETTMLSFLPLAHIYERVMELITISMGGQIGYACGDPLMLLDDLRILRPHFMPSVPRVLNRIYQSAMSAGSAPGLKGTLFRKAVATKLHNLRAKGEFHHALYDRLVFRKIHNVLGGRMRFISTGSAPISANVMDFLKIGLLCHIIEG